MIAAPINEIAIAFSIHLIKSKTIVADSGLVIAHAI